VARKGRPVNRRKKSTGAGKPLLSLVVVLAMIGAALFFLQQTQRAKPVPVAKKAGKIQYLPMPQRSVPVLRQVSPASVAAPAPIEKPQVEAPPIHPAKGAGRVAIIIDDMGASMQDLQALLSIKVPLTFSVIPSLAHAKGVAEAAHGAGAEVMVHMPMEPEGYPKQRMESIGLLLAMDDQEIAKRVTGYFGSVPFAVGANNHMGSRFTQDPEKMEAVLKVLKGKGMFFVDSKTSPASVGGQVARQLGVKTASRQVFLDNVQNEAAIGKQLEQVAAVARKKGSAIAICHPHPATIRTLKAMLPELEKSGITFVHASGLTS
jgi:uncharacterized protein